MSTNIGFIFDPSAVELILATSFVADLHLVPAVYMFFAVGNVLAAKGLAMGAAVANVISIIFIIIDLVKHEDD